MFRHRDSSSGSRASALETSGSTASTSLSIDQVLFVFPIIIQSICHINWDYYHLSNQEPELTEKEVLGFAWQVISSWYCHILVFAHFDIVTFSIDFYRYFLDFYGYMWQTLKQSPNLLPLDDEEEDKKVLLC